MNTRSSKLALTSALLVAMLVGTGAVAPAMVIDEFNSGPIQLIINLGTGTGDDGLPPPNIDKSGSVAAPTGCIGGRRDLTLTVTAGGENKAASVYAGYSDGLQVYSNDSGVEGSALVEYAGTTPLGDFSSEETLDIEICYSDLDFEIVVTIEDMDGTVELLAPMSVPATLVPKTVKIPFSGFTAAVDLANVKRLALLFTRDGDKLDLDIERISTTTRELAAIGDYVWIDQNANGIQDGGELGIEGATVRLVEDTTGDGTPDTEVDTTTTDNTGYYEFTGLTPGVAYQVSFDLPFGYDAFCPRQVGSNAGIDSDGPVSDTVVLAPGENNRTLDAGVYKLASLGDFVWYDDDGDGKQDNSEAGVEGVTVELRTCDGDLVASDVTDANGIYGFTGLMPGKYYVVFTAVDITLQDQGGDDAKDSDADPTTGETICTTLDSGETDLTWDAGILPLTTYDLGIHIEKATNAVDPMNPTFAEDADGPPGPQVPVPSTVTWTYLVTNTGDVALTNVVVSDDGGTPTDISDDFSPAFVSGDTDGDNELDVDEVWLYEATGPAAVGQYGNVADVEGKGPKNETVTDDDPSHYFAEEPPPPEITIVKSGRKICPPDEPQPPCGPCEGKITWLDLQYIGEEQDAEVKVYQKKMSSPIFTGTIQPGDTFKVVGQDDKGTLGTEIYVYIGRCLNAKIHTSCSQPIGPGLVKGDFLVVAGESLKGGPLCAVDASGDDDDHCCGKKPKDCGKKPKGHGKKPKGHGKKKPKCHDCDDDDDCPEPPAEPCDPSVIYVGDTIEYTITVTATGLAEARQIVVADRLDSSLEFLEADPEAQWVSGEHKVVWVVDLPEGDSVTELTLLARIASAPKGDNGPCNVDGRVCSNVVELPVLIPCGPCGCKGKVTELTLQYNGADAAQVKVVQKKDGAVVFDQEVAAGGQFSFSGQDREGTLGTEILVYVDGALNAKIHTSCSQPIGPGLVRGDFVVIAGASKDYGRLCPVECDTPGGDGGCTYTVGYWKNHPKEWPVDEITIGGVTYNKTKAIRILRKSPRGDATYILAHQLIAAKLNVLNGANAAAVADTIADADAWLVEHPLGTKPKRPSRQDGIDLAETLEAYNAGAIGPGHCDDKECDDKDDCRYVPDECEPQTIILRNCACIEDGPPPPPPPPPCGPCDGKVTWLRLQYRAGETARIRVYQKKISDPIFDQIVEPGGIFEVEGQDKKGTLGTEITIKVGCKETKIHTSCSQPIYPGLVKGDFLVLAGASLNGGLLCPPGGAPALPKKRCGDCDDDD